MEEQEFKKLKRGDLVRHIDDAHAYIVDANYGKFAIAVNTVCMMEPSEWEKVNKNENVRKDQKSS